MFTVCLEAKTYLKASTCLFYNDEPITSCKYSPTMILGDVMFTDINDVCYPTRVMDGIMPKNAAGTF